MLARFFRKWAGALAIWALIMAFGSGIFGCDRTGSKAAKEAETPACNLEDAHDPENLDVQISCDYPEWREDLNVLLDIAWTNRSSVSRLSFLAKPILILYDRETKTERYWTIVELANGRLLGKGKFSVVSLGCSGKAGIQFRVTDLPWLDTKTESWPDEDLYRLVPDGEYIARLEFDIYNDSNEKISSVVSNELNVTIKH